ncbi:unnamed protein product [Pedinophyceae sp. YPF-701]|nr:unnamed protein product [Pedinophyceae sp. YPF-701]
MAQMMETRAVSSPKAPCSAVPGPHQHRRTTCHWRATPLRRRPARLSHEDFSPIICTLCSSQRSRRRRAAPVCAESPRAASGPSNDVCVVYDYSQHVVPYKAAQRWMHAAVDLALDDRLSAAADERSGERAPTQGTHASVVGRVLMLQHPPTYTLGQGATEAHLRFDPAAPPHPLYRVERGGEVTYHGPGQLVVYPVLDLDRLGRKDLHDYLRALEGAVIAALADVSGLRGERIEGLTGVWVDGAKLCAVGVRAKRWVTYHGLAVNLDPDLGPFREIVPCGIDDRPVGSVAGLLGAGAGSREELIAEYAFAISEALAAEFGVDLVTQAEHAGHEGADGPRGNGAAADSARPRAEELRGMLLDMAGGV